MCIYILWIMNNDSREIYFTPGDGKLIVEAPGPASNLEETL